MPGFNQKGPMGQGPMTGRKIGRCTNYGVSLKKQTSHENEEYDKDNAEILPDRGLGMGRGRGCGFGRGKGGRGMGIQNRFRGGSQ